MSDETAALVRNKLLGQTSCATCKYLYFKDRGYSNYTVTDTEVRCALDRNPNLPADEPYDWEYARESVPGKKSHDNWPKTADSRCVKYDGYEGERVRISVEADDEEVRIAARHEATDTEAAEAIVEHCLKADFS